VLRLADLLAGLSRLADLGFGLPSGEALRSAVLATWTARSLELADEDVRASLYTSLLLHAGCSGYASESARAFGDELVMFAASARTNLADPRDVLRTFLPELVRGSRLPRRVRLTATTLVRGEHHGRASSRAACEVGREAARRLGLSEAVQDACYRSYEWWDGGGEPDGVAGEDIPVGARLAVAATAASYGDVLGGPSAATELLQRQRGGVLDPDIVDHMTAAAPTLLGELAAHDPRQLLLDAEPRPVVSVLEPELVTVAAVFGQLADLKSPATLGHAAGVAVLARDAARHLGLAATAVDGLEIAGHLHDVGRVAISSAIWDKPGPLDAHEWEQVRLHAYHSERILAGAPQLAEVAALVGRHHERSDGSGYHRGCDHTDLALPARVLAAADAFRAMREWRPHRPALTIERAEAELLAAARSGRLDPDAVGAVLVAVGRQAPPVHRERPAGLTGREVEVLALVARGHSNPEIAERLVISRRTAEQHVQNVYAKIGVSSRAAAALFAMEHGLLGDEDQ
jgi:HD-GYP domain-containing protein (c-di-GMP phosphodiesterase class II)